MDRMPLAKERANAKEADKNIKKRKKQIDTILKINAKVESMPMKLLEVDKDIAE
jgi:hypothetical protein